jgi:hypothetical protein
MSGFVKRFFRKRWSTAAIRRSAAVQRAAREMKLVETQESSIWKSGKGGGHHDRV